MPVASDTNLNSRNSNHHANDCAELINNEDGDVINLRIATNREQQIGDGNHRVVVDAAARCTYEMSRLNRERGRLSDRLQTITPVDL